jgi:hypothetical protein
MQLLSSVTQFTFVSSYQILEASQRIYLKHEAVLDCYQEAATIFRNASTLVINLKRVTPETYAIFNLLYHHNCGGQAPSSFGNFSSIVVARVNTHIGRRYSKMNSKARLASLKNE